MAALILRRTWSGYSAIRSCLLSLPLRLCSSHPDPLEEKPNLPQTPLDQMILKADSVDALLTLLDKKSLTTLQAANVVTALGKLARQNQGIAEAVVKDRTFIDVCNIINKNIRNVNHTTLLNTLKNMLTLGLPWDSYVIRSLETEVLWKVRKMNLRNLVQLMSFHVVHQNNELQRQVVTETLDKIQQLWFEICDPREIVSLLQYSSYFRNEFIGKLEDRAIDLVDKMSVEDLHKIFCVLAEQKLRPTHLLRAIAYHISKHQQKLSVKHMANIIHAMNTLNFVDTTLLQRISADLLPEIHNITKSAVIASLLTAFGQLRWRHSALLEALADWMQKNKNQCRTQDLVAFILTLAHVNYFPSSDLDSVLSHITSSVTKESINSELIWLDVVWSLAVIGKASSDHVASILDSAFYRSLLDSSGDHQGIGIKRKISIINAVAATEISDYKGPLLDSSSLEDCLPIFTGSEQTLRTSVLDTLSNYMPKGKYLACNRCQSTGVYFDAEFIMDLEGKPVALEGHNGNINLPNNLNRMALLVLDYKSYTLNDVHLNGHSSLTVRLLQKMGYAVVQVPYFEYPSRTTTVHRLKYLHQKIVDTIKDTKNQLGDP